MELHGMVYRKDQRTALRGLIQCLAGLKKSKRKGQIKKAGVEKIVSNSAPGKDTPKFIKRKCKLRTY